MKRKIFTKASIIAVSIFLFLSCVNDPENEPPYVSINHPNESPDSRYIAFTYYVVGRNETSILEDGIYIISKENGSKNFIYPGYPSDLNWSPDSKKIAFSGGIITLENGEYKSFLSNESLGISTGALSWAPDGKSLLFGTGKDIYICDTLLQQYRQLPLLGDYPIWLPSGDRLLYIQKNLYSQTGEIYVADTLTYTQTPLTNNRKENYDIKCSPDGMYIAWVCNSEIWIMNTDGTNQYRLVEGKTPSWSSDSQHILYSNNQLLWKIDKNGDNQKQITY